MLRQTKNKNYLKSFYLKPGFIMGVKYIGDYYSISIRRKDGKFFRFHRIAYTKHDNELFYMKVSHTEVLELMESDKFKLIMNELVDFIHFDEIMSQ